MRIKRKENWHFQRKPNLHSLKRKHTFRMSVLCSLLFLYACMTLWKVYNVSPATLAWVIGAYMFTTVFCSEAQFIDNFGKEQKWEGRKERSTVLPSVCSSSFPDTIISF